MLRPMKWFNNYKTDLKSEQITGQEIKISLFNISSIACLHAKVPHMLISSRKRPTNE